MFNLPQIRFPMANKLAGVVGPIKQMYRVYQTAKNPQATLKQMAQTNPQIAQAMQIVQEAGGDDKAAFYDLAKKYGLPADQIIALLK